MKRTNSEKLFNESQHFIPGGVNSPVRAFKSVGGTPVFMKRAEGAYMYDEDDHAYIDLINSWGPMILGHAHPKITAAVRDAVENSLSFGAPGAKELEIAQLITQMVPSVEKVRMVNSGTEATMSAIRLARGFTGRDKVIKMEGHYHGHGDSFLIAAGSGAATLGVPNSPGVTEGTAKDTLLAPFNDIEAIKRLISQNPDQIAAIILEPVAGNMGCVTPVEGYLQELRDLTQEHGIILIFDEVMTGFRLSAGGAQEVFGIRPDMSTFGKIIGGGMPVGAYGGRSDIMDFVAPAGPVYQAGTLSGNPIAMTAGIAMLSELHTHSSIYQQLENTTKTLANGMSDLLNDYSINHTVNRIGSMFSIFFSQTEVIDFESASTTDQSLFKTFFHTLLDNGVYWPPSAFEAVFISQKIGEKEIDQILMATKKFAQEAS